VARTRRRATRIDGVRMAKKKQTFEEALTELEDVVARMEEGELPLDKCLEQYEKGITLANFCGRELDAAEKRIELLRKTAEESFTTAPLDSEQSSAEDEAQ
jgi:exodeoxyribonuclease VII small subunit